MTKKAIPAKTLPARLAWKLERTRSGFSAYTESYPVYTTSKKLESLMPLLHESAALYFDVDDAAAGKIRHIVHVDFRTFFAHYKVLNARILAERIGMNPTLLSQYIRGNKNPTLQQLQRISEGVKQIAKELTGVRLEK
jgi:transcriptional regulator with XRE-family HTH domain